MKFIAACFTSALLSSLLTIWLVSDTRITPAQAQGNGGGNGATLLPQELRQQRPTIDQPTLRLTGEEAVNVAVYEQVNKSVVNITSIAREEGLFFQSMNSEGAGSGIVLDKQGHILTNFHVVEGADRVQVNLFDGSSHEARMIGADPVNDLAVIKIEVNEEILFPVVMANSSLLKVGMKVFTIGNPFGLERTMTTGIISSLNRTLKIRANRSIKSIIQIDAAVNPGNSGGPLIDTRGMLIGVNTAIASKNGQSAGVGFAIPVNLVKRVVKQLIKYGKVIRPEIGIHHVYETDEGLLIERLTPGGPAERAGLQGPKVVVQRRGLFQVRQVDRSAADIIIAVDGMETPTVDDFLTYIETKRPGDEVTLRILRGNQQQDISVTLGGSSVQE